MSADRKFNRVKGRLAALAAEKAAAGHVHAMDIDQESRFSAKANYLKGLAAGHGWKVKADEKARFMVHIIDGSGKDISGPKTVKAAIDFVEKQFDKGR